MKMTEVRNKLMALFVGMIVAALLFVVLFETGVCEDGVLAGVNPQMEFAFLTVMELLTIAMIPLALRLLKFKNIENELRERHLEALKKWGALRLLLLELPLVLNTLFYYLFLNTSFGYMAIILLICMVFVYPSEPRCAAEAFLNEEEDVEK